MKHYADSLEKDQGVFLGLEGEEAGHAQTVDIRRIAFIPHATPENWERLDAMMDADTTLSAAERKIGGLGIHMVRRMTSSMEYQRIANENVLTIVFGKDGGK